MILARITLDIKIYDERIIDHHNPVFTDLFLTPPPNQTLFHIVLQVGQCNSAHEWIGTPLGKGLKWYL